MKSANHPRRLQILPAFAAGVLALSFAGPLTKASGLSPLAVVSARGLLGALVLYVASLRGPRSTGSVRPSPKLGGAVLLSAFLFSGFIAFWTASFSYISIGTSVVVVSSSSFLTFLVTAIRRHRASLAAAAGVCLAVAAVVPVASAEQGATNDLVLGMLLAGLGAILGAGYFLSLSRPVVADVPSPRLWMLISLVAGLGAVAVLGLGDLIRELAGLDAGAVAGLIGLVVGPHVLGQGLMLHVASLGRPVLANLAIVGETIGSAFLAQAMFNEPLTIGLAVSASMFAIAVVLVSRDEARTLASHDQHRDEVLAV